MGQTHIDVAMLVENIMPTAS